MAFRSDESTLVRGADGLIYRVSPGNSEVLGQSPWDKADRPPMTTGLGLYGMLESEASRAMIDSEDHSSARAMIDVADHDTSRAMIDPGDQASSRAMIDAADHSASRAMIDATDHAASRAMIEFDDSTAARAMITPGG